MGERSCEALEVLVTPSVDHAALGLGVVVECAATADEHTIVEECCLNAMDEGVRMDGGVERREEAGSNWALLFIVLSTFRWDPRVRFQNIILGSALPTR